MLTSVFKVGLTIMSLLFSFAQFLFGPAVTVFITGIQDMAKPPHPREAVAQITSTNASTVSLIGSWYSHEFPCI